MGNFLTDPFGFKRRRAAKNAADAKRLDDLKRDTLAKKHAQAAYARDPVPFGKRADVQQVVRARDADTVQQAASTNPMLDPASPLYVGVDLSSYPAMSHGHATHTQHNAPDCGTNSHTSHDSGSGYGGGGSSGDSGGGSSGGCD